MLNAEGMRYGLPDGIKRKSENLSSVSDFYFSFIFRFFPGFYSRFSNLSVPKIFNFCEHFSGGKSPWTLVLPHHFVTCNVPFFSLIFFDV